MHDMCNHQLLSNDLQSIYYSKRKSYAITSSFPSLIKGIMYGIPLTASLGLQGSFLPKLATNEAFLSKLENKTYLTSIMPWKTKLRGETAKQVICFQAKDFVFQGESS